MIKTLGLSITSLTAILCSCVQAQVLTVRLGVHSSCPDGLPGCWSGPYEALSALKGIKVDSHCDFRTWMASATTDGGQFPDVESLDKAVRAAGQFFYIRGCEVTVKGTLSRAGDHWELKVPGCDEPVFLVKANKSHEWDPGISKERELSQKERTAIIGLNSKANNSNIVVTGWLDRPNSKGRLFVEVTRCD